MRIIRVDPRSSPSSGNRATLSVNVDVANGTFWQSSRLLDAMVASCDLRTPQDLIALSYKALSNWDKALLKKDLKRFRHLEVEAHHRGKDRHGRATVDVYKIDRFVPQTAYDRQMEKQQRDQNGNVISTRRITIAQYFKEGYNIKLQHGLPLVKTTKGEHIRATLLYSNRTHAN
jgi:eukaryotic translation initiation factor 2C